MILIRPLKSEEKELGNLLLPLNGGVPLERPNKIESVREFGVGLLSSQ